MHVDRSFLSWGLFLVAAGGIPLLDQAGVLPAGLRWWELWPLLLVGWGVGLLLRRTPLEVLGGVIAALTAGAIVGGLLASGPDFGRIGIGCEGPGTAFAAQTGTFSSTASVRLEPGCGDLRVSMADGSSWQLSGSSRDGAVPQVDAGSDRLSVHGRDQGPFAFGSAGDDWTVTLPTGRTLELQAIVNAGDGRLDLARGRFGAVELSVNAGSGRVDLSSATAASVTASVNAGSASVLLADADTTGSLSVNAGSISLCAPSTLGLRIVMNDNITASHNFAARGLTQQGSTWTTAGYDAAAHKAVLTASASAGSVNLNPEGGCR